MADIVGYCAADHDCYWQWRPDIDLQEYACTDNRRPDAEGQGEQTASVP